MKILGVLDDYAVAVEEQRRANWPARRRSQHLAPQADAVDKMLTKISVAHAVGTGAARFASSAWSRYQR